MSEASGDNYAERQAQKDAAYHKQCDEFLAQLTPEQLAEYKRRGLVRIIRKKGQPERLVLADDGSSIAKDTCVEGDAADLFANHAPSADWHNIPGSGEDLVDVIAEKFDVSRAVAEAVAMWHRGDITVRVQVETATLLQRIIGFFLLPGNDLRIRAHALAHAARMAPLAGFSSLRESSRAIGCSTEAIRKVAWEWVELLNLPPLEGAKSPEARAKYTEDKLTNHWRNQKCTPENLKSK
jgi:hypothetical protein